MKQEITPKESNREEAYNLWMTIGPNRQGGINGKKKRVQIAWNSLSKKWR